MKAIIKGLFFVLTAASVLFFSSCSAGIQDEMTEVSENPVSEEALISEPETRAEEAVPQDSPSPAETVPDRPSPDEDGYFSNSVIIGDSVSSSLQTYLNTKQEALDGVLIFSIENYAYYAAAMGVPVSYRGVNRNIRETVNTIGCDKLFLLLGMNDVVSGGPEKAYESAMELVGILTRECPETKLFLQGMTPSSIDSSYNKITRDNILSFNRLLKDSAEEKGYCYIDVFDVFADENGYIKKEYAGDHYVHMKSSAGRPWAEALRDPANYYNLPEE
jgi:hypothetical protein